MTSESPFNGLTPAEDELLSLLSEECAEVIVAISKIQRHGFHSKHPSSPPACTNRWDLEKELGDVRAATILLGEAQIISKRAIHDFATDKLLGLDEYLHHTSVPVDLKIGRS